MGDRAKTFGGPGAGIAVSRQPATSDSTVFLRILKPTNQGKLLERRIDITLTEPLGLTEAEVA
ncbi:hypothetical protein [Mycobacterium asiaticum]|uniref:Uncharacterized protein n=1 Tax=Mycobacterium asiaticum TaxID=1790 RepID=A0A1A3IAQ6_MYCAS|nr:hypothetical protein [Mycobacterium asiaticum]OBJ57677.1 hypothetical protein A9W94_17080 [Mycobacterium asiaticum]OBJ90477.1 hypothetical protein A5640_24375 [Mycobacterium asiaticum]ORA08715.1 hypothetical protein BST16_26335 [Mycobacterium asiaticum DSM 44297]